MKIKFNINGKINSTYIDADETLLHVLRKLGYKSVKEGCDTGTCGVCSVLIDGKPVLSCSYLAAKAEGHEVVTMEGLGDEAADIITAITDEGADQCGFCGPALVLTAYAMKKELNNSALTLESVTKVLLCSIGELKAGFCLLVSLLNALHHPLLPCLLSITSCTFFASKSNLDWRINLVTSFLRVLKASQ